MTGLTFPSIFRLACRNLQVNKTIHALTVHLDCAYLNDHLIQRNDGIMLRSPCFVELPDEPGCSGVPGADTRLSLEMSSDWELEERERGFEL